MKKLFLFILLFLGVLGSLPWQTVAMEKEEVMQSQEVAKLKVLKEQIKANSFGQTIPLPPSLEIFAGHNNTKVVQLKVAEQMGGTCCFYSLFNARAVQELLQKREPITSETLIKEVEENWARRYEKLFDKLLTTKYKSLGQNVKRIQTFAQVIGLIKLYYIPTTGDGVNFYNATNDCFIIGWNEGIRGKTTLYQLLQEVKEQDNMFIPFSVTVNTNEENIKHALFAAYCKIPGQKPLIIYADSNNNPLSDHARDIQYSFSATNFVRFLINPSVYRDLKF